MTVAVIFPGQGEQSPGMLHRLPESAEQLLREVEAILGTNPLEWDTPGALATTSATQLALLVCGVAWYREALKQGVVPTYLAGHSVGMWAAAVCAGSLPFAAALELVTIRSRAMADAAPVGSGMVALHGASAGDVRELLRAVNDPGPDRAWLSLVNSSSQVVVSATSDGLRTLVGLAPSFGVQRATVLDVDLAAHCPLLAPAAEAVRSALSGIAMAAPTSPILGNVHPGLLRTADQLRAELWSSIDHPVLWDATTSGVHERGVDLWLQLPPGHALAHLAGALGDPAAAIDEVGPANAFARARALA